MLYVVAADSRREGRAKAVALKYDLALISKQQANTQSDDLLLWVDEIGLGLKPSGRNTPSPVYVDFLSASIKHRKQQSAFRNEMIAKAIGHSSDNVMRIVDATAGFGKDAFILASLGHEITLLEKNPIVALLLKDGLDRARRDSITSVVAQRMHLVEADSAEYLSEITTTDRVSAVYLDPMFPVRTKSAKVKKDMQILHQLLGHQDKGEGLLEEAQRFATKRVVVKRPRLAPYLDEVIPSHSIKGKSSRFDVYITG